MALAAIAAAAAAPAASAQELEPPAPQTITELQDGLHTARIGEQVTVFLVTSEGILLGDPLTRAAAGWLSEQLAERFPDIPLRYIVHSHHRFDRAEGSQWFPEAAERVGHRAFDSELRRARIRLPEWLSEVDGNGDGRLQAGELIGTPHGSLLGTHDGNKDNVVTAGELYSRVQYLESTYAARRTITLGGRSVELVHPGPAHAADTTVIYFAAQRIVFAADPPPVLTPPLTLSALLPIDDVQEWLRVIAALDFETLLTGDGTRFARSDLLAARDYLASVRDAAANGLIAGRSLQEVQAGTALDHLSGSPHYAAREGHLAHLYDALDVLSVELTGAGFVDYGLKNSAYCASFETCSTGGAVRAFRGGVTLRPTSKTLIAVELTSSEQSWSSRAAGNYEEEYAFRAARGSLLLGYRFRSGPIVIAPVTGISATSGETRGAYRVRNAVIPLGGRHPIAVRQRKFGITFGSDISVPIGSELSLVVPLRVTRMLEQTGDTWPSRLDMHIGFGISLRVLRHVH